MGISNSIFEIRHALRALLRAPGFAAAAILTLALGIGANTAIFSLVYGVLLRPLPYRDASRLVFFDARREFAGKAEAANLSAPELDDWRGRSHSFERVAGYAAAELELDADRGVQPLEAMCVSAGFFETVGEPMAEGRAFGDDDARSPVAVISTRLWQRDFGGDPHLVGRPLTLSGTSYTIVGVARSDFLITGDSTDVWIPLDLAKVNGVAPWLASPRGGGMSLLARLKPDVTLPQAQADVSAAARRIAQDYSTDRNVSLTVTPVMDQMVGAVRPALLLLFASVGLVLLVACANVTNLLLARQSGRAREIAVRLALGAPRGRLLAQAMIESAMLALAGGAGGVLLAMASVRLLVWLEPAQLPRLDAIRVDGPVVVFAAAAAIAAALLAGLWPALRASREDAAAALRTGGTGSAARGRGLGAALVVSEMAVSTVLLVGAVLLGRSLVDLLHVDIGARTDHALAVLVDFSLARRLPPSDEIARGDAIVARVKALPGVEYAAFGAAVPPSRERVRFTLKDQPTAHGIVKEVELVAVPVTADFFHALGVPLLSGRVFDASDAAGRPPVMIMNADTASLFFGDHPLGHTLSLPTTSRVNATTTLVGVVGNVRYRGLTRPVPGAIYLPFAQQPWGSAFLIARTSGDPLAIAGAVRRTIGEVDRQIGVLSVNTLDEIMSEQVAQPRFRSAVLAALALLAIVLAAVGLYGVIAYSVSRRTAEIGVRMALGADGRAIVWMVLREGLVFGLVGAAVGLAGALALTRVLGSLLFGVTATDPASFAASAALLLAVALGAGYLPARRATLVDPIDALRAD